VRTRLTGLAVIVMAWVAWSSTTAFADVTVAPQLVDVGGVLVGFSGVANVVLDSNNNEHVDLEQVSCDSNAGGFFTFSESTNIVLNQAQTIAVTYHAALPRGILTCQVSVRRNGTTDEVANFSIRGTAQIPGAPTVNDPPSFGALRFRDGTPYSSFSRTVRVTNNGDRTLNITNVVTSSTDYTFTGGTSQSIGPGQGRDWIVTFNPGGTTAGPRNATMTFTYDPGNPTTKTINLVGSATTATIAVTPPTIDFNIVATGSSKLLDATITNTATTGQGPLGVTVGTITNVSTPNWFSFAIAGCGAGTCTFSPPFSITSLARAVPIRCAPPANAGVATQTATVTFTSDSDSAAGNTLTLSCTSGASELSTDQSQLDFAPQLVGTTQTKTLTVLNNGNQDADVYLSITGGAAQFTATGPSCGTMVQKCRVSAKANNVPGSVTVNVTLKPLSEGPVSANIDVIPTANAGPSFTVVGRGTDRHLDLDDLDINGPLEFPDTYRNPFDAPPTMQVPVRNIGEHPLQVENITINGDEAVWSLAQPFSPFEVPPLSTVNVDVKFTPLGAGKAEPAVVRIETDATDTRLLAGEPGVGVVALAGNGKDRNVDMVPGSVDIGETLAGVPTRLSITRPGDVITVVNLDGKPFQVRDIVIEGGDASAFTLQDLNGDRFSPFMIMEGEQKYYDVVFDAPYPGTFTSTVVIYLDQDPTAQTSVQISATAQYVNAHGGGGCSTSGAARGSMLGLIGLVLVLRRRRR
jgi:MYXO-CTERM domain-containing protein